MQGAVGAAGCLYHAPLLVCVVSSLRKNVLCLLLLSPQQMLLRPGLSLSLQRAVLLLSDLSFLLPQPLPCPSLPSLLAPALSFLKQAFLLPHHPSFSLQPAVLLPPAVLSLSFSAASRAASV